MIERASISARRYEPPNPLPDAVPVTELGRRGTPRDTMDCEEVQRFQEFPVIVPGSPWHDCGASKTASMRDKFHIDDAKSRSLLEDYGHPITTGDSGGQIFGGCDQQINAFCLHPVRHALTA